MDRLQVVRKSGCDPYQTNARPEALHVSADRLSNSRYDFDRIPGYSLLRVAFFAWLVLPQTKVLISPWTASFLSAAGYLTNLLD